MRLCSSRSPAELCQVAYTLAGRARPWLRCKASVWRSAPQGRRLAVTMPLVSALSFPFGHYLRPGMSLHHLNSRAKQHSEKVVRRPMLVHPSGVACLCRCPPSNSGRRALCMLRTRPLGILAKHMQLGSHFPTIATIRGLGGPLSATWKGSHRCSGAVTHTACPPGPLGSLSRVLAQRAWEGPELPAHQLLPGPGLLVRSPL